MAFLARAAAAALVLVFIPVGAAAAGSDPAPGAVASPDEGSRAAEIEGSLHGARTWLDSLLLDTAELQRNGVKGKKKLAEILGVYWDYFRHSQDPEERAAILRRVRALAAQTAMPAYHNLVTCAETELTQNSMSYLRVLRVMEDFGLDTSGYRRDLLKARARLDEHVGKRGAWQKAVFAGYYDRFGLEKPPSLRGVENVQGVVAARTPPGQFTLVTAYKLTHEVFAAFDYGNSTRQDVFEAPDLEYLRQTLGVLAHTFIQKGEPDILAEILSSMSYLGYAGEPVHALGIESLLESQNPDGSWGRYSEQQHGKYVAQKLYLHTTGVAVQALIAVAATSDP